MTEPLRNYAVLRFLPYKDIGEFINVGVVVQCPEAGFFDYRLADRRNRRVCPFFPELGAGVYRVSLDAVASELDRHRNLNELFTGARLREADIAAGLAMFTMLLARREGMLHFAAPGTLLTDPRTAIAELYERYVERRFARDYTKKGKEKGKGPEAN